MAENPNSTGQREAIDTEDTINLREYLCIIIKRRRLIAAVWGLIVAACFIYCLVASPIYEAVSVIILDKEDTRGAIMDAMAMPMMALMSGGIGNEASQTMCKVLQSRSVAYNIIQRLNLEDNEDFFPKNKPFFSFLSDAEKDNATLKDLMIKAFQKSLTIQLVVKTQCAQINFASKNPALSSAVANAVVDAYREHSFAMKIDSIRDSVDWIKNNMEQEREKLEVAEQALIEYQEKNDIILDLSKDAENKNMAVMKLTELSALAVKAGAERAEAETRYRQAASVADRPDRLDSVPEIQESELITKIKTMEAELLQRRSELSKKYGPLHPDIVALQSELKTMEAKKEQEIRRVISALENAYLGKLAKEKTIQDEIAAQKADFFRLGKNAREFTKLYVEAAGARAMYTMLLKRLKETEVTKDLKVGNIRVVDKAEPPIKPISPRRVRIMLAALMLGLLAGIGAAFLFENLQRQLPSLRRLCQEAQGQENQL